MEETSRRTGRSILAILAGFFAVVILSLATDLLMHTIGVIPQVGQPVTDKPLLIATGYRIIYTIIGSYITARLAPYQPMLHALWGGFIGLVLGIIGAVSTWNHPALGPHWYPIAIIVIALPCAWAGGRLWIKQDDARAATQVLTR